MNSTGGKSVFESDSLAHSMTNVSKNYQNEIKQVKITHNDVFVMNKRNRNKKKNNLPSLLDDSRVSPRPSGHGQF